MHEISGVVPEVESPVRVAPRLVSAAQEFEGQMMKELLKSLTGENDGEEGDETSGYGGSLREFGAEALGRSLSARGGLGIAREIIQGLSQERHCPDAAQIGKKLRE
jgi:Rod binding domain-containing protein